MKRAVGIDLGTTYSVAAWIDGTGHTAIIPNEDGDLLTPTAVFFDDDKIVVGKAAKKLGVLKPSRLAECVKRDMGSPFFSRPIEGDYLPPEVIQACVLRQLGQDISRKIGPDFGAVITVPAFFDEPRRRATAIAGEIAGLHVLDIVNEPVAAALAFGEHLSGLHPDDIGAGPVHLLVYDLGGGTYDVNLLRVSQLGFHTVATDGDVHLGGRDWDQRLVELACSQFVQRYREDPRDNPVSLQRLLVEIEHAKHTLSTRQQATVQIYHAGNSLDVEITRQDFVEATSDLLERTAHTTRELLRTAGMGLAEGSRIVLAGGSTRMPMVTTMLEDQFGIKPEKQVSPDEAVARGAAIYAQYLLDLASDNPPKFEITHVNSHNLGLRGVERDTGTKVNAVVIPRNTPLPVKVKRTFVTRRRGQRQIAIIVLEGESRIPSECTVIGRAVIKDLPGNLPAGHPVEVTFEYATNGRLHINARVVDVDCELNIEIERGTRLPDDWISKWRSVVSGDGDWPAYRELLHQQHSREDGIWKQLGEEEAANETNADSSEKGVRIEFDEIVIESNKITDPEQQDSEPPLELAPTFENIQPPDVEVGQDRPTYGTFEDVYRPSPVRKFKKRRQSGFGSVFAQVVFGGIAAIIIVHLIWWWGFNVDPLGIGRRIRPPFDVIVPLPLRGQPKPRLPVQPPPRPAVHAADLPIDGEDDEEVQEPADPPPIAADALAPQSPEAIQTVFSAAEPLPLRDDLKQIRMLLANRQIVEAAQRLTEVANRSGRVHQETIEAYDFWMIYNFWFWQSVTDAMESMKSGGDMLVGTDYVHVREVHGDVITIVSEGRRIDSYKLRDWQHQEQRRKVPADQANMQGKVIDGMPTELVLALFATQFFPKPGYSDVLKGCFLASEGEYNDAVRTLRSARQISDDVEVIDQILRYIPEAQ